MPNKHAPLHGVSQQYSPTSSNLNVYHHLSRVERVFYAFALERGKLKSKLTGTITFHDPKAMYIAFGWLQMFTKAVADAYYGNYIRVTPSGS